MLSDDIVAVDSRAIIRTLSAAGTQSRTLCRIGCNLETPKEPMPFIIEGSYAQNCLRQRPLKLLKHWLVTDCDNGPNRAHKLMSA